MPVSRKRKKPTKSKTTSRKYQPFEVVKQSMVNVIHPKGEPKSLDEQKADLIAQAKKADKDFNKSLHRLNEYFEEFDPLYLISFANLYFIGSPEGIDKEAIDGTLDFYPFFIETLQGFSLFKTRTISNKPIGTQYEDFKETLQLLNRGQAHRFYPLSDEMEIDQIQPLSIRMDMMISTLAIRNWSFEPKMKSITYELARLVSEKFRGTLGFDALDVMNIIFGVAELAEDKLNDYLKKIRAVIGAGTYQEACDLFERNFTPWGFNEKIQREEIWKESGQNLKKAVNQLMLLSDSLLKESFTFSLSELHSLTGQSMDDELLTRLMDQLSFKYGDLSETNRDHIFLSNPIHAKPFIKLDDGRYFSGIIHIFPHLAMDILEQFMLLDKKLKIAYSTAKANYLEEKVRHLFSKSFPNSQVLAGSLWKDPESGKTYENDLIVLVEDFAVIVEAKSGTVTAPARRGAPGRLFDTIKELVISPSEQAIRFEQYLTHNPMVHTFNTKAAQKNVIDASKIKYFVPIGVTLSSLGFISCNLKKIIEAKVSENTIEELAPSISLADLEVIFDILTLEAEKIHYLSRRREFEAHINFQGDEMDLFAFYLDNGFNIGPAEYDPNQYLLLIGKSKEIDPYILGTAKGLSIKKPQLRKTKYWEDLLNFTRHTSKKWMQFSYMLLNAPKEEQAAFEKKFEELKTRILKNKTPQPHNYLAFICGPERRQYAIIGYAYKAMSREDRNLLLQEIIEDQLKDTIRGIVIIGYNLDSNSYPYSIIAGTLETDFFDSLYID